MIPLCLCVDVFAGQRRIKGRRIQPWPTLYHQPPSRTVAWTVAPFGSDGHFGFHIIYQMLLLLSICRWCKFAGTWKHRYPRFNDVTAPYQYAMYVLYICLPFSHTVLYLNKTHLKRFRHWLAPCNIACAHNNDGKWA